jgi:hypothetical protein
MRRMPLSSAQGPRTFTLRRVELEIRPEPSDEERAAIEAALEAAADARQPADSSSWRAAGVREATGRGDDDA